MSQRFALSRNCCFGLAFLGLILSLPTAKMQAQAVSLSATTVNFGNVVWGTTSAIKKVTLTNTGTATLSITSIVASPDFLESNTCKSSVAPGSTCTISIAFNPPALGTYSGTVTITDNANDSPQTIATTGSGINSVTVSLSSLTFASFTVGTTSSALPVNIGNNQTTTLNISSISVTGDFAQTNNCGSSLTAGQRCTINVTFTPTVVGTRTGTLTVTDSGNNSPQTVSLSGTGNTNGLTSITVTPANLSLGVGATQQYHAKGTFTGGSTYDLTQSVTWSSSATGVASISNTVGTQGLATALAAGTSTIGAAIGQISDSTLLTVTATLQSITVTPAGPSITLGNSQQFTATGNYSDGSTQNLTNSASWSSSATNVATINSTGLASSVAAGTTTISATVGSVTGTTTLTVNAQASQSTWTQQGPVARFAHSAIYDPTSQQIVIFGGQQSANNANLNDVWLQTTSLTNGSPLIYTALLPGGTAPSARFGHTATYDQTSNRMTVFGGGLGSPGPCSNDVWILDGANGQSGSSNWLALSPSGSAPNARLHHTGVYDPGSNTLTVFGGSDCNGHFFNDVWVLSNANGKGGTSTWTQLLPTGSLPAARQGSSAIYDPVNHIMTIYGGDAGGGSFGDAWVLSNANGQGGTPVWTKLSPTGTAPHVRTGHSAVYDSANNRMIVFGGNYATTTLGDTWILTFANGLGGSPAWTQLSVQGTAPVVEFHSAVYSQALNNMYVFAGTSSTNKLQTSNHSFTLTVANGLQSGSQWYVGGPPVRYSQSAFYDPATTGLFVYAGQHTYSITYSDYDRDIGVMSGNNVDWTKLSTATGAHPLARFGHTGLYDSPSNRMMVFGGSQNGAGPCMNDYWILSNANTVGGTPTWLTETPSGTAPTPRMRHTSVYDSTTNSLIIFGGFDCTATYFNDVWILSNANAVGATPVWSNIVPLGTPPSARENAAGVYDAATNSLILFGGDAGSPMFSDVWVLSHANGSGGTPTWTQLTVSGNGPSARTGHSAVYDNQNSRMVIYGGWDGTVILNDTWILANANGVAGTPTWIQLTTTTAGPTRYDHSAVYDPASNRMIIFGGYNAPSYADANVFSLTNANGLGAVTLVSVAISPQNPAIALGGVQQFTATGTYSDGSSHDITSAVTWASSLGTVASISNTAGTNGLATSLAVGSTTISATLGTTTSSTTLTVGPTATLISITVSPSIISLDQGLTQQFTATGNYSDGSTQNLTNSVTWTSSGAAATVTSTGLATAAQLGSANVVATSGSISGSGILVSILTGAITAFPDGVYFPPTLSGTTSTIPQTAVVYNLGSTSSTITNIALTGSTAFKLISGTYPITLAPNAYTTYMFSFTPTGAGSVKATATFSFSTTASQTVTLNGEGLSTTAVSSLNTSSLAFGNQPLGSASPAKTVTITNSGTTAFTLESVTTTLPFLQTGYTSPVKVNPGSSFSFQVQYVPFLLGDITGTISMTYDVLPNQSISLTGTGTAANALGISTFPTLPIATEGGAYQATLTAVGGVGQTNWTLASGSSLPAGLSLSSSGLISGTVSSSVGLANYSFVVQVTDSNNPPSTASLLVTMSVQASTGAKCNNISWDATGTTSPLVAITDLGTGYYGTYQGGLYANGSNVDDPTHHAYGVSMAQAIQPLDVNGNPNPNGKYALLTIGHSNTEDVSDQLVTLGSSDPAKSSSLVLVNGGTGSSSADELQDPSSYFWGLISYAYLPNAGVSPLQVEVVWLNDVDVSHPPSIPDLQSMLENIARIILSKFPNTKILYLSSVNYTAYSNGVRNAQPEPTAYETGFAVKALIQDQVNGLNNLNYNPANGPVVAPWASWAAYYWTDGLLGRNDGLTWSCQDNINDGVHPATSGRVKAAGQLLNFLKTDDTAVPWF